MSDLGLGLSYVLPRTEFTVDVTTRSVVRSTEAGHVLDSVADVQLASAAVADTDHRHTLRVDAGLLEKISLVLTLDDRGFITAVNSEAGRDISPVVSLVGKAVSLATAVLVLGVLPPTSPAPVLLESEWERLHPELETLRASLGTQAERLLADLIDQARTPAELADLGRALDAVQDQLAAVSQARRAWIAGQSTKPAKTSWRLAPADLHRVDGAVLPETISPTTRRMSASVRQMVADHGVLPAIADPSRSSTKAPQDQMQRDCIALRRSRPVVVGIYTKDPDSGWTLDRASMRHMDVVDDFSPTDPLSIDGSWWRMNKFELSFHPDMSLKTFGVGSTPSIAAVATSAGEVMDALGQARKDLAARPTADEEALARAKTQLDLLTAVSGHEVLAATRGRAAELAVLEQQKKLREATA